MSDDRSNDGWQLLIGLGMLVIGVYFLNREPAIPVWGWVLALFGTWVAASVHSWIEGGLLDIDTWTRRGSVSDSADGEVDDDLDD